MCDISKPVVNHEQHCVSQTADERRQELDRVLSSQTLSRSAQLRDFLNYICEKVIAGQAADLKEYVIGVEVFHRPPDYSPANDSCVRSRAWELRQKLEEYYTREAPHSALRIVLPKGSYVPQFLKTDECALESGRSGAAPSTPRPRRSLVAFLLGVLACAAPAALLWYYNRSPVRPPALLMKAWGPLVGPNANVLVVVASGLHLVVRPYPFNETPSRPAQPVPPEVYEMLKQFRRAPSSPELYLRPSDNLVQLNVVSGVVAAANTLHSLNSTFQILPERAAPLPALRGRNVILFGDPTNSNAVAQEMKRAYWVPEYDPKRKEMVIRDRRQPPSVPPLFSRAQRSATEPATVYGLLTILPSEGAAGEKRTIVVSGISSVGVHGAMEFFSSPQNLARLQARLRAEGYSAFPPSYQVAVRCTADDTMLLSAEYAAHVVIGARQP
jgi:hypothetical protein